MTWRFVYACSTGTSHSEQGEVCQDMCQARVFCAPDGDEYFLGLVSDGAGSASHGGYGAAVACTQGVAVIGQWIQEEGSLARLTSETVKDWVVAIRQNICHTAEARGLTPRDFACTLLGAVVGTRAAAFFQIGDGAIVIGDGGHFTPIFWPDTGQYANMTYFVTDADTLEHLRVGVSLSPPDEIALFSDGLQRLALVYESRTAYAPFFEPMFATIRRVPDTCARRRDILFEQLRHFLDGPQINERTDDDKSLVLATHRYDCEVEDQV